MSQSHVAKHRQKQSQKGLVRVEIQASNADAALLREVASALRSGSRRAAEVRSSLRRSLRPSASLFDLLSLDIDDELMKEALERSRDTGRKVKL